MLKYKPRQFYNMLSTAHRTDPALPPQTFAEHFKQLFYNATDDPEASPPTHLPDFSPITAAELHSVLGAKYNGAVSSGMCALPSQIIKHLHGACLNPLATYLNLCVGGATPP
jgi:hypothetical protein